MALSFCRYRHMWRAVKQLRQQARTGELCRFDVQSHADTLNVSSYIATSCKRCLHRAGALVARQSKATSISTQNKATPTQEEEESIDSSRQNSTLPTQNEAPPTQNEAPPTQNKAPPTQNEALPTQNEAPSTQNKAPPTQNEALPTQNETPPTQNEAPPTQNEAPPTQEDKVLEEEEELQRLQAAIAQVEAEAGRRVVKRKAGQYDKSQLHVPVMAEEVLHHLGTDETRTILDMTFGAGGHARALLDQVPGCHIFALDRDPLAHEMACKLADERPSRVTPLLGRFSELPTLLSQHGIEENSLDGVLMDLGSSSMQFDQSERGFSISGDGPLDMRMDGARFPDQPTAADVVNSLDEVDLAKIIKKFLDQPTAADVVNSLDEVDLAKIIKKYGDEGKCRQIAHGIVEARSRIGRIRSTQQLAQIILHIFEGGFGTDKLGRYTHPATKTFQALRIFINNEMNELNNGLEVAHAYLRLGGTCAAISFHSLEDRVVKRHFKAINLDLDKGATLGQQRRFTSGLQEAYTQEQIISMTAKRWQVTQKKAQEPTEQEVERNPRSRSAKLRAAIKMLE